MTKSNPKKKIEHNSYRALLGILLPLLFLILSCKDPATADSIDTELQAEEVNAGEPSLTGQSLSSGLTGDELSTKDSIDTELQAENANAAVLIVLGQSNAYGHATTLPAADRFNTPLENVYGLKKSDNPTSKTDDVVWGKMESDQDFSAYGDTTTNRGGLANVFAKKWQAKIDATPNTDLPDLYVITIARSGRAIAFNLGGTSANGWSPKLRNSLFDAAKQKIVLALKNLKDRDLNPVIVGVHWNQWEGDAHRSVNTVTKHAAQEFEGNLKEILENIGEWVGDPAYPLWLYYPQSDSFSDTTKTLCQTAITNISTSRAHIRILDVSKSPNWTGSGRDKGVFVDGVHYTVATHKWFADQQLNLITG